MSWWKSPPRTSACANGYSTPTCGAAKRNGRRYWERGRIIGRGTPQMAASTIEKTPSRSRTSPRKTATAPAVWPVPTRLSMEKRRMLVSDRPIKFEEWLDRGGKEVFELVRGSLVEK